MTNPLESAIELRQMVIPMVRLRRSAIFIVGLAACAYNTCGCSGSGSNSNQAEAGAGGGSSETGGATSSGGSTASTIQETPPVGLESLPSPAGCQNTQTECNGSCLDLAARDANGCHVVGETNVAMAMTLNQNAVYFSDYDGITRLDLSTESQSLISSRTFASPLLASGNLLYYYSISDSLLYSLPTSGGAETKLTSVSSLSFLSLANGYLVYAQMAAALSAFSLTDGTSVELASKTSEASSDGSTVYFTDNTATLKKVDPAAPTAVTTLGTFNKSKFVVTSGVPYYNAASAIYRTDSSGSGKTLVWQGGSTSAYYKGTITGPFAFPAARGLFFFFNTTPYDHLMYVPADGSAVRRLASFTPKCGIAATADASHAYVGTCRHVIRLTY